MAELIRAAGAEVWYLPPYRLDFNPIENMWLKIKQILRSLKARMVDDLVAAIGEALRQVTTEDILGWFTHAGYTT